MILVALRTGLRHGELIGLRWEDVDLFAGRITVRQNVVDGHVGTPKSGKPREIPLGDEVRAALKEHRHLRRPLVFCDIAGVMLTTVKRRSRPCRRLGHSSIVMTMRYAHLAPETVRETVRLLDGLGRVWAEQRKIAAK